MYVSCQTVAGHSGLQTAIVTTVRTGRDGSTPLHRVIDNTLVRTSSCPTPLEKAL